jgi:hypothetical protein
MTAYDLLYGDRQAVFTPLLIDATVTTANNIKWEDGTTDNHANRLAWAVQVSADPRAMAMALRGFVAAYVVSQGGNLDAAAVQTGVDGSIASVIPAAA